MENDIIIEQMGYHNNDGMHGFSNGTIPLHYSGSGGMNKKTYLSGGNIGREIDYTDHNWEHIGDYVKNHQYNSNDWHDNRFQLRYNNQKPKTPIIYNNNHYYGYEHDYESYFPWWLYDYPEDWWLYGDLYPIPPFWWKYSEIPKPPLEYLALHPELQEPSLQKGLKEYYSSSNESEYKYDYLNSFILVVLIVLIIIILCLI